MTLFNVRLGAWLPNPGCMLRPDVDMKARLQSSSPQNALRPLLGELLGLTDASSDYVYLSDGGHFENLGIYEMIRRRCRFIVVSDAGCDPKCRFEDLGNAVRKVAIDLDGTMIDFTRFSIGPRGGSVQGQLAYALGTIRYPEGVEGRILYVKPSYFGDMPMDVRAYAEANAEFPHQTTADQWFSESQFESYRRLGLHFVAALGKRSYGHLGRDAIRTFFDDLKSGATGASAATFTWRQPLQARAPGCGPNQGTR